ncbi:MAG: hypothetical protein IPM42_04860 [Saprospiraceae bacterium]|nr:hypothetical protein [Saprospiraceae bacterium]
MLNLNGINKKLRIPLDSYYLFPYIAGYIGKKLNKLLRELIKAKTDFRYDTDGNYLFF